MLKTFTISIIAILLLSSCSASIGTYESGLWFDSDKRDYQPKGIGVKFDLVAGRMVRPFPKSDGTNPWVEPAWVLDIPFVGPFISVSIGDMGAYLGFKSFRNHKGRYDWLPSDADPNDPDVLYTISGSVRRTRWK